jgi:hypothetical protein
VLRDLKVLRVDQLVMEYSSFAQLALTLSFGNICPK